MPELPEVEIVRRGVDSVFRGRTLSDIVVRQPSLRWAVPPDLMLSVGHGAVLRSAERRSKYLLLDFERGTMILHLGMSGTLRHLSAGTTPGLHDHVDFQFGDLALRYNDPRRFGAVLWSPLHWKEAARSHALLSGLGLEPFDPAFDGEWLYRQTRGRTVSVKQMLLSGKLVVGVGNIYASESLFHAGIRPTRAAGAISRPRYERLAAAIRRVLGEAIEAGGSSLKNFVAADGASGCFQTRTMVYDREGEPCRTCGEPIRQIRQQQRSTFYCPACQPR